ncbi:P-loop containing nucleoside triphosphate hydrolase protein [Amniculicola lignicola CBS 123094]|uniref:P-loop containing nucleoside triphosphate hydrolase protein n=1 Tax=Amniculicola lignicola CBS 123094 TaxID=1392246 RepID=A0A6A5X1F6_9PLEO|nr:P-loop containing nucleoside triphosphate hydrolase protein [Amniculicola lignicola CBS 123094]
MAVTTTTESVADFDVKSINSSGSDDGGPNLASIAAALPQGKDTKEELPSTGMMCDVKNLWEGEHKCLCCTNWLETMPEDIKPNPEETEAVQRFALVVRHKKSHGFSSKAMMVSSIVIQSPLLKPLLEEVFDGYAGITATLKKVAFSRPFAPFFYRWSQFKKVVESQEDPTTRTHAQLLYDVLSKELDETLNTYHDLLSHGVITFNYLWTLFKPGDLLLCSLNGHEMIMKLQSCDYSGGGFSLASKYIDYNGHNFGYASNNFVINAFEGTKTITDLDAYPIQFNGEAGAIESRLATRGKRFEVLQGYHFKLHKGKAEMIPSMFGDRGIASRHRQLNGRVIIYAEMYDRYNSADCIPLDPLDSISFAPKLSAEAEEQHHDPFKPAPPPQPPAVDMYGRPFMPPPPLPIAPGASNIPETHEPQTLADELYPLCTPIVKGYSLRTKNWAKFHVDNIHDIVWDDRAFDSLVLPPGYKDLILSFTRNQNATEESKFDDVIEGKGQGIVMLLTGEPGVGKTLTAESVAEYMRVPLYSMSAAQLGTDSYTVEQTLGDILEMATKWKAVLLLDETEVFLEQRTIDGLERNKLVSIFLRMLEYYRGVLFLTTNRVSTLDKALESRIHLKISYPELDQNARLRVWENLIELLPPSIVGLDASDLEILSQRKLNGREIKNVIKAAQLLAKDKDTALNLEHVHTVLRITQIGGEEFGVRA